MYMCACFHIHQIFLALFTERGLESMTPIAKRMHTTDFDFQAPFSNFKNK